MANTCTRCGDPATTLTDDGDLLCDDCDTTSHPGIAEGTTTTVHAVGGQ